MAGIGVCYHNVADLIGGYLGIAAVDKVDTLGEENETGAKPLGTQNTETSVTLTKAMTRTTLTSLG